MELETVNPSVHKRERKKIVVTKMALTPALLTALKQEAEERGIPQAKVVREIFRAHYAKKLK